MRVGEWFPCVFLSFVLTSAGEIPGCFLACTKGTLDWPLLVPSGGGWLETWQAKGGACGAGSRRGSRTGGEKVAIQW